MTDSRQQFFPLIEAVIKWNSDRYDRVYNQELTERLLAEEIQEANDATDAANYVKELMDIVYISIGALWKYGHDADAILGLVTKASMDIPDDTEHWLDHMVNHSFDCARADCGLSPEQALRCFKAVCDSNATKSVKKAKPDEKANDKDKGPYYRPAEPAILAILNEVDHGSSAHH